MNPEELEKVKILDEIREIDRTLDRAVVRGKWAVNRFFLGAANPQKQLYFPRTDQQRGMVLGGADW